MLEKIKATTSELTLLPINLQLFADDGDGDANESQSGVVDSIGFKDESFEDDEDEFESFKPSEESKETDIDEGSKDEDIADPQSDMTPEQNKAYQKIRQKAEAEARATVEKDRAEILAQQKQLQEQIEVMQSKEIEQKYLAKITDEAIENYAYEKGYSVDSAKEILLRDARIAATYEINQRKQATEINRLKMDNLKNDRYFKHIEPQLSNLLKQDPNVDVNGAYNYLLGELLRNGKMDDLIQEERKSTQQKTLADVQDRSRRKSMDGGSGNASSPSAKLTLSGLKAASVFGVSTRDVAEYVKQNSTKKKG